MKHKWERIKDRLFGPRCERCWLRVFPRDKQLHDKDCD